MALSDPDKLVPPPQAPELPAPDITDHGKVVCSAYVVLTEQNTWQVFIKFDPKAEVPLKHEAAMVLHNEVCKVVRLGLPAEGNGNGHSGPDAVKAGQVAGLVH